MVQFWIVISEEQASPVCVWRSNFARFLSGLAFVMTALSVSHVNVEIVTCIF